MNNKNTFYVGTYTEQENSGIYQCTLDLDTGKIDVIDSIEYKYNPTFLALHKDKTFLYSCDTIEDETIVSSISSFKINNETKNLTFLNKVSSHGTIPAHVIVDSRSKHILTTNYGSGSVCCYNINDDGSIGDKVSVVQHTGSSTHPTRQTKPHPHSINLDSDNKYAFVCDLGTDKLMIYKYDQNTGSLVFDSFMQTQDSSGPRHLTFSPDGNFVYLITEMGNSIYVYQKDGNKLNEIQEISTLPSDFEGESNCAEIAITPYGRYLYGSNRGHDSIVAYSVDKDSGKLELIGHFSCGGKIPRHFAIDKSGRFLVVANQLSGNVCSFKIDNNTGELVDTGSSAQVPEATCIRFY